MKEENEIKNCISCNGDTSFLAFMDGLCMRCGDQMHSMEKIDLIKSLVDSIKPLRTRVINAENRVIEVERDRGILRDDYAREANLRIEAEKRLVEVEKRETKFRNDAIWLAECIHDFEMIGDGCGSDCVGCKYLRRHKDTSQKE